MIRDVTIETIKSDNDWRIYTTVYLSTKLKNISGILETSLKTNIETIYRYEDLNNEQSNGEEVVFQTYFTVSQVSLSDSNFFLNTNTFFSY